MKTIQKEMEELATHNCKGRYKRTVKMRKKAQRIGEREREKERERE